MNAENFPDEVFREYVSDFDNNGDEVLSTSELAEVTEIDVAGAEISSLKGIEYFTGLVSLDCSKNMITELDVSKNTSLLRLTCNENRIYDDDKSMYVAYLSSLNVTGCTALQYLSCYGNALTTLDLSTNTALTYLDCAGNELMTLDVSKNTALNYLDCWGNYLTALDVSKNTALTELECGDNKLAALDLSKNTSLVYLGCENNRLTALDVSGHRNLQELYCEDDDSLYLKTLNASGCTSLTDLNVPYSLTHLNVSGCTSLQELAAESLLLIELNASGCTALTSIYCGDNEEQGSLSSLNITGCTALKYLYCNGRKLTSLNLSNCTNLVDLSCNHNSLTALDVSKNLALENLECNHNYLTSLNVSSNTALTWLDCSENDLTALDVSSNTALTSLYCSSNRLSDLDVSSNTNLEYLYFDDNYLSEVDLSSNIALTNLCTSYNQSSTFDLSGCTELDYLYCDFPITAGANSTWELDFTAFKEAYGLDGEFYSSYGVTVYYSKGDPLSNYTIDQSSGKYILRFLRLADGTLKNVHFTCKLNDSDKYISIRLVPFVDSSSLTAPLITTSSLPAVSVDKYGVYNYYDYYLSAYGSQYLTWKVIDGFLPAGIYMDTDGEIHGYPVATGSSTFTVRAKNKVGSSTRTFTIVVPYTTQGESPLHHGLITHCRNIGHPLRLPAHRRRHRTHHVDR